MSYIYKTDCTHAKGHDIREMLDLAREITWETFRKHVHWADVKEIFPDYSYKGEKSNEYRVLTIGFHIKDDWAVSFWKSKYRGVPCYFITHSGIEYIWTKEN